MKKVMLVAILASAGFMSNAQTLFGLQAGANFASGTLKIGSLKENYDTKVGLIIGALADVDFGNSISFRPELNYIQKGGKYENSETFTSGGITRVESEESEHTYSYIQLSPNFVYNIPAGKGKLFLGLGPEFSFGISGKGKGTSTTTTTVTGTTTTNTASETEDIEFDGDKDATDNKTHLKSFDYGANLIAGYKLSNGAFLSTGYTLGLGNISPYDNVEIKNRGFFVKLGVLFGGPKKK